LSFTAVVIRTQVIQQIGLLDEKYFSYHEDTDFCFRARLQGWRSLVVKDAVVHHKYKFPSKKNKIRYFWLEKNRLYLMLKFFKFKTLILILPAFIFMEFGLILFSIVKGFFGQRLKAYGWLIMNLASIFKARRQIQQTRKYDDAKLFNFFSPGIDFQEINNPFLKYIANPVLNIYFKIIKRVV
jgi:GT2 family glycosyltransferase